MKVDRMKRITKAILAAVFITAALAMVSDSAPQKDAASQLKLSKFMPKGALLYAQSSNLGAQFKMWQASPLHDRYFSSKNYDSFQESRLFLKLQSRSKEFETALGLEFTEDTIASLVGGASAIGVYDLGKLEMVVISEMPRPKAFATVLFANAKSFDERTTGGGTVYYMREFVSDGGRSQQRVAFAYAGGNLVLASNEGLLQRTLENIPDKQSNDRLIDEISPVLAKATDFSAHNITLWVNQSKLNANRYFDNYWVHHNVDDLNRIQAGLIDLEITTGELKERRWFTLDLTAQTRPAARNAKGITKTPSRPVATTNAGAGGQLMSNLLRFAPSDAQFIEARGSDSNDPKLVSSLAATLFGQLPDTQGTARSVPVSDTSSRSNDNDSPGRYRHLDSRYDRDIDDEAAVKLTDTQNERANANARFSASLATVIAPAKPDAYVMIETPELSGNKLFVHFNRAVVINLGDSTALSTQRLESAVADEMQQRFVVGNAGQRLGWQVEGSVHYLKQALLEQGGAYAISGKSLIIASNKEYCAAVVAQAATTTTYKASLAGKLQRYAIVRPGAIKPIFAKLAKVLDANQPAKSADASGASDTPSEGDTEEGSSQDASAGADNDSGPVTFFGQNVKSLLDVIDGVDEATYQSSITGDLMIEVITYHLS
ncbi:MAG TPA: hypothetical protein VFC63_18185 [Blastocatellia bacterium]|nr:hypothetical protein [Blastocatellia bacterium]